MFLSSELAGLRLRATQRNVVDRILKGTKPADLQVVNDVLVLVGDVGDIAAEFRHVAANAPDIARRPMPIEAPQVPPLGPTWSPTRSPSIWITSRSSVMLG